MRSAYCTSVSNQPFQSPCRAAVPTNRPTRRRVSPRLDSGPAQSLRNSTPQGPISPKPNSCCTPRKTPSSGNRRIRPTAPQAKSTRFWSFGRTSTFSLQNSPQKARFFPDSTAPPSKFCHPPPKNANSIPASRGARPHGPLAPPPLPKIESVASLQGIMRPFAGERRAAFEWFGRAVALAPRVACPRQSARRYSVWCERGRPSFASYGDGGSRVPRRWKSKAGVCHPGTSGPSPGWERTVFARFCRST